VFAVDRGEQFLLTTMDREPTYDEILQAAVAREGSKAAMTWVQRIVSETKFNQESLNTPPGGGKKE
jgi:hypothetical protein